MPYNRCKLKRLKKVMFDRWLVVTDMDGTLLNHHDYDSAAARPVLQQLEQMHIPVIFNTSKTFNELYKLADQLHNRHPFILENGSAIALPEHYFSPEFQHEYLPDTDSKAGYKIKITGADIESINSFLNEVRPHAINFNQCNLEQAVELTGLSPSEASHAQNRQYSVALIFSHTEKEATFIRQAQQAGFSTLRGGRFLHVLGRCDKGSSMQILKELYSRYDNKSYGIIALGDSQNDEHMLQQSDAAVVVKSPSSDRLKLTRPDIIYTQQSAPHGWAEGVLAALKSLNIKQKISTGET